MTRQRVPKLLQGLKTKVTIPDCLLVMCADTREG